MNYSDAKARDNLNRSFSCNTLVIYDSEDVADNKNLSLAAGLFIAIAILVVIVVIVVLVYFILVIGEMI